MKKFISLLACVALVMCLIIVPVSAEGFSTTVTPSVTTASAGEQFIVNITIAGVPADEKTSAGAAITLSDGLEFINGSVTSAADKRITTAPALMASFDTKTLMAVVAANPSYKNDPDDLMEPSKVDHIRDGQFVSILVKVREGVTEAQTVSVTVTLNPGNVTSTGTATIQITHEHKFENETAEEKYLKSAANCDGPAVYFKSCSICGEASETETFTYGEKLEHQYKDVVTDPTCTDEGYTTHTCELCGNSYVDSKTDALSHKLIEEADAKYLAEGAACTEPATFYKHCERCDFVSDETFKSGEALGHTKGEPKRENEKAATCYEEGSYDEVIYCTVCGEKLESETKTIEKTAHTPAAAVKENEKAATCTDKGSYDEVVYCSVCKEKLSTTKKETEALGHDFASAWSKNDKEHWHDCSRCDATDGNAAHVSGEWVVVKQPTTEATGLKQKTCTECEYVVETETIDKLIKYDVTNGGDSTFKKASPADITVETTVPKESVTSVSVNGVVLDPSKYEISGETGAVIKLKSEYLSTLAKGSYTLTISNDLGVATTTFTVEDAPAAQTTSPKTGNPVLLWVMILLLSNAVLVGSAVYRKRVR